MALIGSAGLIAFAPVTANADPTSDLAAASEKLESLSGELSSIQQELASATEGVESTDAAIYDKQVQINELSAKLTELRSELGTSMRLNYKSGTESALDLILGSTDIEDLVSRIYYLDRISRQQSAAISTVTDLEAQVNAEKSELESTRDSQQAAVDELQSKVSSYSVKLSEARSYYESLDAEIKAQVAAAAAQEENASLANAVTVIETAPEVITETLDISNQSSNADASSSDTNSSNNSSDTNNSNEEKAGEKTDEEQGKDTSKDSSGDPSEDSSSVIEGGGVSAAYEALGHAYVYGGAGPDVFDCSGLICYIYGWKYGHSASAMMNGVRCSGNWKTSIDELEVGDLVFPYSDGGHVGVYVGNGKFIHAANPSRGVVLDDIYAFYGGGPY